MQTHKHVHLKIKSLSEKSSFSENIGNHIQDVCPRLRVTPVFSAVLVAGGGRVGERERAAAEARLHPSESRQGSRPQR